MLVGAAYAPGVSTVYTLAQLTARMRCRVVQGTVTLWDGFAERPEVNTLAGEPLTTYRLVGKTDDRLAEGLAYVNSSGWPSDDDWESIVGQTPRVLGSSDLDTVWAPYSFDGRVGAYVGQIGLVTGRLPGEDRLGRLGMATYRQNGTLIPVASSDLLVSGIVSEHVTDVRNIIDFPFDPVAGSTTMAGAEGRVTIDSGSLGSSYDVTIAIPQPDNPNTTFTDFQVELQGAVALVILNIRSERYTDISAPFVDAIVETRTLQTINIASVVSTSFTVQGGQYIVTFTIGTIIEDFDYTFEYRQSGGGISTSDRSGTLRNSTVLGGAPAVGDGLPYVDAGEPRFNDRFVIDPFVNVQLIARLAYTVTNAALTAVDLQNPTSRAAWGDRQLDFPLWVAHSALQAGQATRTRIQADLDYLAAPRLHHDITLPLWQETTANNETVAALDFGSYVDLALTDTTRNVNIDADCLITSRTLVFGATVVPAVLLRLLETGQ